MVGSVGVVILMALALGDSAFTSVFLTLAVTI